MSPSQYMLHVNFRPTAVSNALWKEGYRGEHLPDLQDAKVSDRATFYEEIGNPLNPNPDHPRKFLALYQTSLAELLKSAAYQGIRKTSEIFGKEGTRSDSIQGKLARRVERIFRWVHRLLEEFEDEEEYRWLDSELVRVQLDPAGPGFYVSWTFSPQPLRRTTAGSGRIRAQAGASLETVQGLDHDINAVLSGKYQRCHQHTRFPSRSAGMPRI